MTLLRLIVPLVVLAATVGLLIACWRVRGPRSRLTIFSALLVAASLIVAGLDIYYLGV
jgi:hypothetical protein